jgi:hypothetical protein
MLDFSVHQAAGLHGLKLDSGAQLIAMVSHGDERSELPLLWKLCATFSELGYGVTVLDATTRESNDNPGLTQLLDYGFWQTKEPSPDSQWTVLPATRGLQDLCCLPPNAPQGLQRLGNLFAQEGVVILFGKPEGIALLLYGTNVSPLLAVSSWKNSLLTSYLAFKRLLINGRLTPTIVSIVEHQKNADNPQPAPMVMNLIECARNFLGVDVKALQVPLDSESQDSKDAIRGLALRLLESAMPIGHNTHHAMPELRLSAPIGARNH